MGAEVGVGVVVIVGVGVSVTANTLSLLTWREHQQRYYKNWKKYFWGWICFLSNHYVPLFRLLFCQCPHITLPFYFVNTNSGKVTPQTKRIYLVHQGCSRFVRIGKVRGVRRLLMSWV